MDQSGQLLILPPPNSIMILDPSNAIKPPVNSKADSAASVARDSMAEPSNGKSTPMTLPDLIPP